MYQRHPGSRSTGRTRWVTCILLCGVLAMPVGTVRAVGLPWRHVPGPGPGYDSGPQLKPRQLAWAALVAGAGLAVGGLLTGHRDLVFFGGVLAPVGGLALWRDRDTQRRTTTRFAQQYDLTHYGEDMRYLFDKHPNRDMIARSLIRRFPEMHLAFLFSLGAFGPVTDASADDAAFAQWYRSVKVERNP